MACALTIVVVVLSTFGFSLCRVDANGVARQVSCLVVGRIVVVVVGNTFISIFGNLH